MVELYADQTGTEHDPFSILGGVVVDVAHLSELHRAFMAFKLDHDLKASSPVKTAGWREQSRYRFMKWHGNQPALLTDTCTFIAERPEIMLIVAMVEFCPDGHTREEGDEILLDLCASRLQMEMQPRTGKRPKGTQTDWKTSAVYARPHKQGVHARMIVDHPGTKKESDWADMYTHMWKMEGRSKTKLTLLDDCLYFGHMRSCAMLQLSDVVVGAVRSYLRDGPRGRFETLLPRFRTYKGHVQGMGLIFDPKEGRLAQRFSDDYPAVA